ncbi:MAG: 5-bromo-4-chloroindolyl phosphate hydrolysis family protein [Pseudomonadota bacterium]
MDQKQREAGLRQAERYGGPASQGRRPPGSSGPTLGPTTIRSLAAGGVAAVLTLVLGGSLGLAFLLGMFGAVAALALSKPGGPAALLDPAAASPVVDAAAAKAAGVDPVQANARLAEATRRLKRIDVVADGLGDPPLAARIHAMADACREALQALAEDPSDMDLARKFLVVTVPSAEASVEKYAKLGVRDAALSERFGALMDEVAEAARRQKADLKRDDAMALEVEMGVLADRLRQS